MVSRVPPHGVANPCFLCWSAVPKRMERLISSPLAGAVPVSFFCWAPICIPFHRSAYLNSFASCVSQGQALRVYLQSTRDGLVLNVVKEFIRGNELFVVKEFLVAENAKR